MKKTLVLALAMALGISATALAANPFSDLPEGHWAYASVAKLTAAGVVDGFPDGEYKGDNLMTRYEMAQIVAKALAKGAIGADDRLVGEFADELNSLGVRVAKLEKKADNVKINGQARFRHINNDFTMAGAKGNGHNTNLRTRIWLTGQVNDNWQYESMLENIQDFSNNGGDEETRFQRANLKGNIGAVKIVAGRYDNTIDKGYTYDDRVDGIKATVGKNVKFTAEYGKMANGNGSAVAGKFYHLGVNGNAGPLELAAHYINAKDVTAMDMIGDDKIWTLGATYAAKDWSLGATYLKGSNDHADAMDVSQTGWVIDASYKGAKALKPGSWGMYANYYNQGASTVIAHTMNGGYDAFGLDGFKGYMVGANLTVARNMVGAVEYYDLKDKESDDNKIKTLWAEFVITF